MGEKTNKGQEKTHEVFDAEGNPLQMTQAEWRNRDKTAGFTRPEDDVEEEPTVVVEDVPTDTATESS